MTFFLRVNPHQTFEHAHQGGSQEPMALVSHRKQKIYLAATMGYGLGSDDPEEVAFYNKIKEEMKDDKKNGHLGITRED